jgi:hypothetical protein
MKKNNKINLANLFVVEKTYKLNKMKAKAIVNFSNNTLVIEKNDRVIFKENLNNYTNANGLNMEGYIEKIINNLTLKEMNEMEVA